MLMARRLQPRLSPRQPPKKMGEAEAWGGDPPFTCRRRRVAARAPSPHAGADEGALDDDAEGAQATGSGGSQGLRLRLTARGQREQPTPGYNTAKGAAGGLHDVARDEPLRKAGTPSDRPPNYQRASGGAMPAGAPFSTTGDSRTRAPISRQRAAAVDCPCARVVVDFTNRPNACFSIRLIQIAG